MTTSSSNPPKAALHTPEELLQNAKYFLSQDDSRLFRAALTDSITALESLVASSVFPVFASRYGQDIADWMEKKTRMDFDSRLSVFVPIATGLKISKKDNLFKEFEEHKAIRNKVIHGGQKITKKEAEAVVANVSDWMALILSTVDLERELLNFKRWFETKSRISITKESQAIALVQAFFSESIKAPIETQKLIRLEPHPHHADLVLTFGSQKVVIETKLIRDSRPLAGVLYGASGQLIRYMDALKTDLGCIIIFAHDVLSTNTGSVLKLSNGIKAVLIEIS